MPVPFDNSQELWIGFNCNTTSGYPAGCDDGPQVEGWSNMMYWEGEWVTLTSLNPDLIYNWAIKGYIEYYGSAEALLPIEGKPVIVENVGELALNPSMINPPAIFTPEAASTLTFNVYRDGVQIAIGLPTTTYTDYDLWPYGTYTYFVTAVVDGYESNPSNEVVVWGPPPPPGPPQNLQYEITVDSIHLFWEPPLVYFYDFYKVYRNGSFVENVEDPEYFDPLPNQFPVEYYVTAFSGLSGESDTSNHVIIYDPQGIIEQNAGIHLFPNPSNEILMIDAKSSIIGLTIFDISGLKVYAEEPAGNKMQINTSRFPPGIYTLQLETEKGVVVRKVVVQ
jgi:hypothetical protein